MRSRDVEARRESRSGSSSRTSRTVFEPRAERMGRVARTARADSSERTARASRASRVSAGEQADRLGHASRALNAERTVRTTRSSQASRASREAQDAREQRRRERAKSRAERMYSKQFGDSQAAAPAPEEGSPRAAVYEGQMGAAHRRSARMQRSSVADSASAKMNPAGWFASSKFTERTLKVATGMLCVILACAFLYVPAQQYYQAQREHDRLVVEHDEIEKRNDALDVQNDILASDAGIEDAVRQKYGYVKLGEQTAIVTGLSDEATSTARGRENIEASVLSSSVKADEEWYTPLLDTFFGVE